VEAKELPFVSVKTEAFKKVVETVFKILKEGKVLDAKTFAHDMQISLGTANKWLARLTAEGVLLRTQVNDTIWGGRKYVYVRNEGVEVRVAPELQQRLFMRKLRRQQHEYK
jgi:predicted transcriptional regulator